MKQMRQPANAATADGNVSWQTIGII